MKARHLAPLASLVLAGLSTLGHATVVNRAITESEVTAAQAAWCQALVDISAANDKGGQPAAKALAEKVIDAAYGYQLGAVLFKPTLAAAPQTFRITRAGALAYFVGATATSPRTRALPSRAGRAAKPRMPLCLSRATRPPAWATW
ncbi:hypothetical protein [Acidovorax sp. 1608163]|uniref:hypothetical protein n=1 Tax=Acidovorax sp. 1608163 TaxID=2478662 RepID=UPI001F09EF1C